jgi:nucleoid-associated protein YgaU
VTAENMRDAAHDYDHLLASKASMSAKMSTSAGKAMQSASAAMLSTTGALRRAVAGVGRVSMPATPIRPAIQSFAAVAVRALSAAFTFAALCLLGVAVAGMLQLEPVRNNLSSLAHRFTSQAAKLQKPITPIIIERSPSHFATTSDRTTIPAPNTIGLAPATAHDRTAKTANELIMRGRADVPSRPVSKQRQPEASVAPNIVPVTLTPVTNYSAPAPQSTVMVRAGDTLSKIAMRLYGSFQEDEVREDVSRIRAANPQIKNANLIYPGQSIRVQQASK